MPHTYMHAYANSYTVAAGAPTPVDAELRYPPEPTVDADPRTPPYLPEPAVDVDPRTPLEPVVDADTRTPP